MKDVILSETDSRNGPIKLAYFVTPCSKYSNLKLEVYLHAFPQHFQIKDWIIRIILFDISAGKGKFGAVVLVMKSILFVVLFSTHLH